MLELGVGAEIFRSVGILLWIVLIIGLCAAIALPKSTEGRVISTFIVLAIFFGPMLPGMYERMKYKQRYNTAKALFDERCKGAGLKIYKTVEGVEGLFLAKLQKREGYGENAMELTAATYGMPTGESYISEFLYFEESSPNPYGYAVRQQKTDRPGFQFVEAIDPKSGERYRYTWRLGEELKKEKSPSPTKPRYEMNLEYYVLPEDRAHWIASSSLKITDTETSQIMAEMLFYKFDRGLGSQAGHRTPWGFAVDCPNAPTTSGMYRFIANKVLRSETQVKK